MMAQGMKYIREHDIVYLLRVSEFNHPTLAALAESLTQWEASVRYNNVCSDTAQLQLALDSFQEIFTSLYKTQSVEVRVRKIVGLLDTAVPVDKVLAILPSNLPDSDIELMDVIKSAIRVLEK